MSLIDDMKRFAEAENAAMRAACEIEDAGPSHSFMVSQRRAKVAVLKANGLTHQQVADALGIARSMVVMDVYFNRQRAA
ncbi:helix-turn-helix domain-containing protein [uncultured Roseobacter sp.]|uniref:helix-turn-helix domain-containing protein n=1 Tax=uncultured Roseobacter sp. TaxID=114847 RepID=UPI00261F91B8|nr:helix-turn-helix domain-containing protein [uncultured Roseobacter sp.]